MVNGSICQKQVPVLVYAAPFHMKNKSVRKSGNLLEGLRLLLIPKNHTIINFTLFHTRSIRAT
jgi:hypothetical protein